MSSHPLTPGQIMGPALVTIAEDATVAHTLRLARVNQIHHLSVLSCRAREPHPLASLIREHQVLGELAEALESFSTCVQAQPTGYDRADLASFARARPGAVSTGTFTERKYPVVSRHPAAYELERAAALAGGAPHL